MTLRRTGRLALLGVAALTITASAPSAAPVPPPAKPRIVVYKDPDCGCCKSWVEHLLKHGFDVAVRDTNDMSGAKRTGRVPGHLVSCHTGFVNGYVIEGHVPAQDILRLLAEKPRLAGLAVAGMPAGSPGMEVPGRVDRYDVVGFSRDGTTRVYARH